MSVVVERGLARCPRCVAVADYTFVESGPNSLRYEVRCGRCGAAYCEVHTPFIPDFSTPGSAVAVRAPEPEVPAAVGRRQRALTRLAEVRATLSAATARGTAWVGNRRNVFRS